MSQRLLKLQQWVVFFCPGRLFGLCLLQYVTVHLEDMLQTSFTFLFLTQPLAQASCSKGNYASFMLSKASLQSDNGLGWTAPGGLFWTTVLLSCPDRSAGLNFHFMSQIALRLHLWEAALLFSRH